MTENYVETLKKNFWRVSTRWTGFWPKITVLTQNGLKLIFYPGQHDRTRVDLMDSVLTENDSFDPKRLKTHFLPWSTWFDPYWLGGLGFDRKWRFWPKTHFLPWSTCFDPYWLGGLGFDRKWRFWPENSFFTWPTWFDLYWPGGIGSYGKMRLTREKYIFEFSFFLNFFGFL